MRRSAVLLLLAVAACAPGAGSTAGPSPGADRTVTTGAAAGLSATVQRDREDVPAGRASVLVRNTGRDPVHLTALTLAAPVLATATATRPLDADLAPGERTSFVVGWPALRCTERSRSATVTVDLVRAGSAERAVVPVLDTDGTFAREVTRGCREVAVAEAVSLTLTGMVADGPTAVTGTLLLGPGPRPTAVQVDTVVPNVLFRVRSPGLPTAVRATTTQVPLVLTPARCDGHALGEVKKPWTFAVRLRVDGLRGPDGGPDLAVETTVDPAGQEVLRTLLRTGCRDGRPVAAPTGT